MKTIEENKQQQLQDFLISRACRFLIVSLLDCGVSLEVARKEAGLLKKFLISTKPNKL